MLQVGGPFSFHLDRRLQQKRDRHVSVMDRAALLDLSQCVSRDQGLGNTLVLFLTLRPQMQKRDRCLWLGNGLSYAQPSTRLSREAAKI